jgi:hypothetical protein
MNVGIGTVAVQFIFWNICFEFSVLCLCSVEEIFSRRGLSFGWTLKMKAMKDCQLMKI